MHQGPNIQGSVCSIENRNHSSLGGPKFFFFFLFGWIFLWCSIFCFDSESTPALSGGWTHGFVGALGNKRAFDPLLHICNPHAPREVSIHAGNMTRGKTVGAFPQMCRRSATPPRDRWSFWNRVTGIDRSISGTRASNLSLLVGLNT